MFSSKTLFALSFAAAAAAQKLQVLSPGGPNLWWVAQSENTIAWNCEQTEFLNFTIVLTNSDPNFFAGPLAIVAIENNFDCSKTITQQQETAPAGTGYTIRLANPLNATDVYAESDPFEIKALGATYPAASATPTAAGTASASASANATGSGAAAASSGAAEASKSGAMHGATVAGVLAGALAAVVGSLVA